ncbi:MAG: hypothetical protein ACREJU_19990 [Nitrospiraceae bacterium]
MIPSDRSFNPAYQTAISEALLNLQDWYADQLGGKTFTLRSPIVEPVFTGKPSISYSPTSFTQYFFDVSNDAFALRGGGFFDANQVSVFYMDAEGDGSGGGGVAVLPAHDLRGLVGLEPLGVNRWIGGLGHELGHAFGLPHPPACEVNCPFGPLMGFGYLTYPDAFLLPEDKAILNASLSFTRHDLGTPPNGGNNVVPEPHSSLLH